MIHRFLLSKVVRKLDILVVRIDSCCGGDLKSVISVFGGVLPGKKKSFQMSLTLIQTWPRDAET